MATSTNRQSFFIDGKENQMLLSPVDRIIKHLLEARNSFVDDQRDFWFSSEIEQLYLACSDIFLKESSLLELKAPIKIAGDLHGQFDTLLSIFEHDGLGSLPPRSNYLFLGNHGDRIGFRCNFKVFKTVTLLLALKIKYPKNIFLLRGSHDGAQKRIIADEHEWDDPLPLYESVNNCLSCLPVAALINSKIICAHGGLSPYLHDLDQIRRIERPCRDVPSSGLLRDLIGSHSYEATSKVDHYAEVVNRLNQGLRLICCDHNDEGGYRVLPGQGLVTICSGSRMFLPGQGSRLPKVSAMMRVDAQLMYSFRNLHSKNQMWKPCVEQQQSNLPPEKPCPSGVIRRRFKYTSAFAGFKSNSEISTTKSESSPPTIKPEDKTILVCPQSSRTSTPTNYRNNHGSHDDIGGTESESKQQRTHPATIAFDPTTNLYRRKNPGVKRFLGARV